MKWCEWFFDGIGTQLISLIIGAFLGGISGYKIGIRKNGIQKQEAAEKANQKQELEIEAQSSKRGGIDGNLRQVQKAGANSKQSQIGRIKK